MSRTSIESGDSHNVEVLNDLGMQLKEAEEKAESGVLDQGELAQLVESIRQAKSFGLPVEDLIPDLEHRLAKLSTGPYKSKKESIH